MRRQSPLLHDGIEALPMTVAQREYAARVGRQCGVLAERAQQLAGALDALPALVLDSNPLRNAAAVLGAYAVALAHVQGEVLPDGPVETRLAGAPGERRPRRLSEAVR